MYKIINEDINKWSEDYDGELFHALFCDAPYHLTTITKRFGKEGSAPAKFGTDGAFGRVAKGFMNQEWDGGDIAFRPETWEGMKKHLFPGAFGMTFGGSRTAHRIAVAIEDAGFIIHPMIGWVYGSGFPKATRIKGHEEFDGHRYGLQALKPALEPIIVFQKPFGGKPVENIVANGAGALNIDGGRIPLEEDESYDINRFDDGMKPFGNGAGHAYTPTIIKTGSGKGKIGNDYGWATTERNGEDWEGSELGRWPSNFIIDDTVSGLNGNSKFFFNVQTNLDEADPFIYEKKVSQKERNAGMGDEKNTHPTLKSISLTKYLSTLLLPPVEYAHRRLLVPFSGVSSEMIGALLAGWEYVEGIELTPEYIPIAHKRIEHWVKS